MSQRIRAIIVLVAMFVAINAGIYAILHFGDGDPSQDVLLMLCIVWAIIVVSGILFKAAIWWVDQGD